jgi:hypothetical protein
MGTDTIERAYEDALRRVLGSGGASVLDLGGDFARRAVVACRLGAGRVYSVQSASSSPAANALALANGCGDAIRCIETLDTLPRAIDVVMAEVPGDPPLHGLSLISHPVIRNLIAGGTTPIPRHERLSMALVDAPDLHFRHAGVWDVGHGLDFAAARRLALNTWSHGRVEPGQLLAESRQWAACDYTGAATSMAGRAEWTIARAAVAHGLAVWPEVTLAEGVVVQSAPGVAGGPRGQAFFPWMEPVRLVGGDHVSVTIRADALGTGNVWTWTASVRRNGAAMIAFRQSTFLSSVEIPAAGHEEH